MPASFFFWALVERLLRPHVPCNEDAGRQPFPEFSNNDRSSIPACALEAERVKAKAVLAEGMIAVGGTGLRVAFQIQPGGRARPGHSTAKST